MPICPTADFILQLTNLPSLAAVKSLTLSNYGFDSLDAAVFQKMTSLTVLDLSRNKIKQIPGDLCLRKLQKLDLSDNLLTDAEFVVQFPALREVLLDGNQLESSDLYIALTVGPQIEVIDRLKRETYQHATEKLRKKLQPQVEAAWEAWFGRQYQAGIPEELEEQVGSEFTVKLGMSNIDSGTAASLKKYVHYMVDLLSKELLQSVKDGSYEPPTKRACISNSPTKKVSSPMKPFSFSSPAKTAKPLSEVNSGIRSSPIRVKPINKPAQASPFKLAKPSTPKKSTENNDKSCTPKKELQTKEGQSTKKKKVPTATLR